MSKPLITVILPSLNVKKYIRECMDSVIGQSFRELEILCIDAGSTDGTLEILEEYALSDQRIRIIHSEVKSYGKQINMGFELAEGKYVAIVETDDYIDLSMYEKLYAVAEENQLDFVKADFRGFRVLRSGTVIYDEGRVWGDSEVYGKILSVIEFPKLYLRDVNIWKGIYRRDFLIKNAIRLNETAGAAFQDIGFSMLFLLHAKRGMYVDDLFYYYRRDNEDSSSNKPYGLRFAYQEFRKLLDDPIAGGNMELFYHYLYIRMIHVFMGEYEKLLRYGGKPGEEFREMIGWFQEKLGVEIGRGKITEKDIGKAVWDELCLLIGNEDAYAERRLDAKRRRDEEEQKLLNKIGRDRVVVFGCGYRGRDALLFCDRYEIETAVFCDNDISRWGDEFYGYRICAPAELLESYSDAKILISTNKYGQAVREQLEEMGICGERIAVLPSGS